MLVYTNLLPDKLIFIQYAIILLRIEEGTDMIDAKDLYIFRHISAEQLKKL